MTGAAKGDVRRGDAGAELQDVRALGKDAGGLVVDDVRAVADAEDVGVGAIAADQSIVAKAPIECVVAEETFHDIVAIRALQQDLLDIEGVPKTAVGETELLDVVMAHAQVVGAEVVPDRQAVGGADDIEDQVVTGTAQNDVRLGDAVLEDHPVVVPRQNSGDLIVDDVLAVAAAEDIGVAVVAAVQGVVAGAAVQPVVIIEAVDGVVALRLPVGDHLHHDVFPVVIAAVVESEELDTVEPLLLENTRIG